MVMNRLRRSETGAVTPSDWNRPVIRSVAMVGKKSLMSSDRSERWPACAMAFSRTLRPSR